MKKEQTNCDNCEVKIKLERAEAKMNEFTKEQLQLFSDLLKTKGICCDLLEANNARITNEIETARLAIEILRLSGNGGKEQK